MKITILIDNDSWIIPYGKKLNEKINNLNHSCSLIFNSNEVEKGDILILMGCVKIFKKLNLNKNNIVIHESDLPLGKGWSPLTWQILEGKNKIPITLFEATDKVDNGMIYLKDYIILNGDELNNEIKHKQGEKTIEMAMNYINNYYSIKGIEQNGIETFYKKRTPKDSELNINKTIDEQFNLLRVCDNERYPAFFFRNNVKYKVIIEKYL